MLLRGILKVFSENIASLLRPDHQAFNSFRFKTFN
jgi:hypothetical protein